ncbi:MAG: right-handed parallel beta-helix repeat-containing protein [Candidatus Hydrogenedentes bacterium]|nr:right-handed parallel beta-helix repeat-containing protein [Candidatus Hydrogenedentota bacterium]
MTLSCGQNAAPAPTPSSPSPTPSTEPSAAPQAPSTTGLSFAPGPDVQAKLQEALITVKPGSTIQLEEGTFELTMGLSLDVDNVTIRGRGMDKTILSFKNQDVGTEGLYITSDNVTLEDFTIQDTKGNGHKSNAATNHVIRRVKSEWTGGPKETNGAYAFYPVSSKNVLIEECVAIGASDAGIYVGQSENVIVRKCRAEYNVAGIEIENCHHADVYENVATHNAGGILVFDLPDLPVQHGRNVRIFRNKSVDNDTENFAPKGNIVASVPTGTGVMVMANSSVEIFENEIGGNATTNILLTSYLSTQRPIKDAGYYPYPEGIHIHSNSFGPCGNKPGGDGGALMALIAGSPLPDIVWDGMVNPEKLVNGELPPDLRIYIGGNTKKDGEVTFANIDAGTALKDPATVQVKRDLAAHAGSLPPLQPVTIEGVAS